MKRLIFRARIKRGMEKNLLGRAEMIRRDVKEYVDCGRIMSFSLFSNDADLYLYYECVCKTIMPAALLISAADCLEYFAHTNSAFMPMMDIYHNNIPKDEEQWRRRSPCERHIGVIARLKPEMVSSYIFWHYQQQEEAPGRGHKYGIIALHENMLFFYKEAPLAAEKAWWKGNLNTQNTPFDRWSELMDPHFIKWENAPEGQDVWLDCNEIVTVCQDNYD